MHSSLDPRSYTPCYRITEVGRYFLNWLCQPSNPSWSQHLATVQNELRERNARNRLFLYFSLFKNRGKMRDQPKHMGQRAKPRAVFAGKPAQLTRLMERIGFAANFLWRRKKNTINTARYAEPARLGTSVTSHREAGVRIYGYFR